MINDSINLIFFFYNTFASRIDRVVQLNRTIVYHTIQPKYSY